MEKLEVALAVVAAGRLTENGGKRPWASIGRVTAGGGAITADALLPPFFPLPHIGLHERLPAIGLNIGAPSSDIATSSAAVPKPPSSACPAGDDKEGEGLHMRTVCWGDHKGMISVSSSVYRMVCRTSSWS